MEPTEEEARWIRSLRRCLRKAPKSVWLFSDGDLNVMQYGPDGETVMVDGAREGGVDHDYVLTTINYPHADGGGW